jgi:hypothetical protein
MHDIVRCYADVLYLKTMRHLPPQPVAHDPEPASDSSAPAAPVRHPSFQGPLRVARYIAGALARHLEHAGSASALAGKRCFRRIGG